MNKEELYEKINKHMNYYEVVDAEDVMLDDNTRGPGYALVNRITGVTEFTTPLLAGIIWQAQHFESTMDSVLNPIQTPNIPPEGGGDILPFGSH